MQKHSIANRAGLHLALAILMSGFAAGCATIGDGSQFSFWHHCKNEPLKDLTVSVTGLVKLPGRMPIPPGGLQLLDAVTLAGGDLPAQRFGGLSPAQVLVSLQRPTGTYMFSLPLVTHDVAGHIYLKPGDRVRVEPVSVTILANSMLGRSATDITGGAETWKALLRRDDVGKKALAYDVPFVDQFEPSRDVTVTIAGSSPVARASAPTDATAAPVAAFTVQADFSKLPPSPYRAANLRSATPNAPNLLNFGYAGQSDPESTVLVLNRILPGENYFIVLLRPESLATGAERAAVTDLLGKVTVLPGDAVAIGALVQMPIVLNSLVGAQLFDYAAVPQCGKQFQQDVNALTRPFKPFIDPVKAACGAVGTELRALPGAIENQLPR
jgi:protein involved in polysaccharide export with SLBB domain